MAAFLDGRQGDFTDEVARELMSRIRDVIPVLSVPLISRVVLMEGPISREDLIVRVSQIKESLVARGIPAPRRGPETVVKEAVTDLSARGVLSESADMISVNAGEEDLLVYYAGSIAHHFDAPAAEISAIAE